MLTRILIVEDNAINQKVAQAILRRAGYSNVDAVWDGSEALQACSCDEYDLVLMDCQMPNMDGLEATRQIRKLDRAQPIIIGVTAHALVGQREICLESGMDDFLTKPYRADQLLNIIHGKLTAKPEA